MADFEDIAGVNDLPVGRVRTVVVGEKKIALARTSSGWFALDNTCPHRGGPLGEGDVIGAELVCPWHLWGFDVVSGVCLGNPEVRVATHEVKLEGERVLVKLL